jgi:hypothetical protein
LAGFFQQQAACSGFFLAEFHQHASRMLGVQETDKFIIRSLFGNGIEQYETLLSQSAHLRLNVRDIKRNMVQAGAFLFYEPGNYTIRVRAFQQFNFVIPLHEKSRIHFLGTHFLGLVTGRIQQFFKKRYGLFQRAYRNADMFYFVHVLKVKGIGGPETDPAQ